MPACQRRVDALAPVQLRRAQHEMLRRRRRERPTRRDDGHEALAARRPARDEMHELGRRGVGMNRRRVRLAVDDDEIRAAGAQRNSDATRTRLAMPLAAAPRLIRPQAPVEEMLLDHAIERTQHRLEAPRITFEPAEHLGHRLDSRETVRRRLAADPVVPRRRRHEANPRQTVQRRVGAPHRARLMPRTVEDDQRVRSDTREKLGLARVIARVEHRNGTARVGRECTHPRMQLEADAAMQLRAGEREVRHAAGADRDPALAGMLQEHHARRARYRRQLHAPADRLRPQAAETECASRHRVRRYR